MCYIDSDAKYNICLQNIVEWNYKVVEMFE